MLTNQLVEEVAALLAKDSAGGEKPVYLLMAPSATGKSHTSQAMAEQLGLSIINADKFGKEVKGHFVTEMPSLAAEIASRQKLEDSKGVLVEGTSHNLLQYQYQRVLLMRATVELAAMMNAAKFVSILQKAQKEDKRQVPAGWIRGWLYNATICDTQAHQERYSHWAGKHGIDLASSVTEAGSKLTQLQQQNGAWLGEHDFREMLKEGLPTGWAGKSSASATAPASEGVPLRYPNPEEKSTRLCLLRSQQDDHSRTAILLQHGSNRELLLLARPPQPAGHGTMKESVPANSAPRKGVGLDTLPLTHASYQTSPEAEAKLASFAQAATEDRAHFYNPVADATWLHYNIPGWDTPVDKLQGQGAARLAIFKLIWTRLFQQLPTATIQRTTTYEDDPAVVPDAYFWAPTVAELKERALGTNARSVRTGRAESQP